MTPPQPSWSSTHVHIIAEASATACVMQSTGSCSLGHQAVPTISEPVQAAIGCSVGTVSFCLQQTIKFLFTVRENVGRYFLDWDMVGGYMLAWFFYVAASAFFATVASILVVMVAPAASASGVPQIMAFLNGVRMPKARHWTPFSVAICCCVVCHSCRMICPHTDVCPPFYLEMYPQWCSSLWCTGATA